MTLTEFLLARIGEDEATAREAATGFATGTYWGDELWEARRGGDFTWGDTEAVELSPARVLKDCEAKRWIVRQLLHDSDPDEHRPGHRIITRRSREMLKVLALSYDTHPDYDQGWKP